MLSVERAKTLEVPSFHQHPTQITWLDMLLISIWTLHLVGAMVTASTGRQTLTENASLTRFKQIEHSTGEPCSTIPSTLMTIWLVPLIVRRARIHLFLEWTKSIFMAGSLLPKPSLPLSCFAMKVSHCDTFSNSCSNTC